MGTTTMVVMIHLDPLLMSLPMLISSDLLTSHLSIVTFNLVQQRLAEPHHLPKCALHPDSGQVEPS